MLIGVWFLLFALILLTMVISSVVKIFKYFSTKDKSFLKKAALPWLALFLFIGVLTAFSWYAAPIPINKNRIVGSYEIDTNFYSGANADWQREHFRFQVTSDDKFVFFE